MMFSALHQPFPPPLPLSSKTQASPTVRASLSTKLRPGNHRPLKQLLSNKQDVLSLLGGLPQLLDRFFIWGSCRLGSSPVPWWISFQVSVSALP
ncbi:hypothetical protein FKM82_027536 [Ascaphus truei]